MYAISSVYKVPLATELPLRSANVQQTASKLVPRARTYTQTQTHIFAPRPTSKLCKYIALYAYVGKYLSVTSSIIDVYDVREVEVQFYTILAHTHVGVNLHTCVCVRGTIANVAARCAYSLRHPIRTNCTNLYKCRDLIGINLPAPAAPYQPRCEGAICPAGKPAGAKAVRHANRMQICAIPKHKHRWWWCWCFISAGRLSVSVYLKKIIIRRVGERSAETNCCRCGAERTNQLL